MDLWLTRLVFQRALGLIYLVAFAVALNQFRPLLGERGLLPAGDFMRYSPFWQTPSLFYLRASDGVFAAAAWGGVVLSSLAVLGVSESRGFALSMGTWAALYVLARRLLEADRATLALLAKDPFEGRPPRWVRARLYRYRFTTPRERRETGLWWRRELVGDYLPPAGREAAPS